MIETDKNAVRARLLEQRQTLTQEQIRAASLQAVELIRTLFEWKNATEALMYWPIKGEVDLRPLVAELWQRECRVLMPRCRPDQQGIMDLACAACESDLIPGEYSVMVPDSNTCPAVNECNPQIALIPGVGYDRKGNRIGFGGGYYDRLLAKESMRDTLVVGVGYDFQLIDHIPTQPWDKPVDVVCTEKELWRP
ncbi:5-formyltetrahydrofolate cyclo-ligase [Pseudodesulfovibrio sediminis]|uniref:5-formyltetrahydrofolate cyclo-ligase n=1 Tax=Pseudodesulfovibrio sediminis TaxID=2810563 RepID=A0ABM7P6W6_9BACT|nr:5-formyltetrahydrofolate cyclo-ligase [Pseudodesulfovibrio sediminis]BCS88693.1 hypothetical protein PSDVSF_19350 [Pseudodesulfovibrio sediminis]